MLHADAVDRLTDAATERHGIERVMAEPSSDPELRAHVASCASCQREVRAWQQTAAALLLAAPGLARAAVAETPSGPDARSGATAGVAVENAEVVPVVAPPLSADAKDRVLASIRTAGVPRGGSASLPAPGAAPMPAVMATRGTRPAAGAGSSRRPVRFRWLALAAAAVLAVFVSGALLGGPLGLVRGNGTVNADQLKAAVAASGHILQQPDHRQAALLDARRVAVGSVLVDPLDGEIVVLSNGGGDADAAEYHCYLVRGSNPRTWLGKMNAQAGTSFWAGQVDDVADLGAAGDIIEVVDGGTSPEFTATF